MNSNIIPFTEQFAEHRKKRGLSYRALEGVVGIKYSALAAMENGHRAVGEQSARRLAGVFGLSGDAREAFVLSALNTSKEKILAAVANYPAEILNALGLLLLAYGIKPKQIVRCDMDAPSSDGGGSLCLSLAGGRLLRLETQLVPIS